MRKTEGRRRLAWALALGWAFAGGLAEPLGAKEPEASNAADAVAVDDVTPDAVGTVKLEVEPFGIASAATATTTAAATAAQSCPGSGFCVTVIDHEARIPFTGIGIKVTCKICECTWAENGRLHRSTKSSCTSKIIGVS